MGYYFADIMTYYESSAGRCFGNYHLLTVESESESRVRGIFEGVCEERADCLRQNLGDEIFNVLVSFSNLRREI